MKPNIDYLIIGQGLAGTLLAHFLLKIGKRIRVIDNHHGGAASKVAAGIINPITGRRYVKSWRIETFLPFARQTYRELEDQFSENFFYPNRVLRALFNRREENDWMLRLGMESYGKYLEDKPNLGNYAKYTVPAFGYGEVKQAAQVDIGNLVRAYSQYLIREKLLIQEKFEFKALKFQEGGIIYKNICTGKLIFCEGHQAVQNPFFNYLPFAGTKGEILKIKIPGVHFEKLLKHRIFLVPLGDDVYWVGANYEWDYENDLPTTEGRIFLEERLKDLLKVPFEIQEHLAGIRPTVKDRRPFLGQHPQFSKLFIFNGLGAKGASLGPYWAKHMADFLVNETELDPEVNITRFM